MQWRCVYLSGDGTLICVESQYYTVVFALHSLARTRLPARHGKIIDLLDIHTHTMRWNVETHKSALAQGHSRRSAIYESAVLACNTQIRQTHYPEMILTQNPSKMRLLIVKPLLQRDVETQISSKLQRSICRAGPRHGQRIRIHRSYVNESAKTILR